MAGKGFCQRIGRLLGPGNRTAQESRRKARRIRAPRPRAKTGRTRGRPKKLVPRVRLAGKQTLVSNKTTAKNPTGVAAAQVCQDLAAGYRNFSSDAKVLREANSMAMQDRASSVTRVGDLKKFGADLFHTRRSPHARDRLFEELASYVQSTYHH